jgi:hypothetical protein
MRALDRLFALTCIVGAFAAGSASAQPAPLGQPAPPGTLGPAPMPLPPQFKPPTTAEIQAAVRELAPPRGIGGCVLMQIDPAVRSTVLMTFGLGQPGVPPALGPAVAKVSQGCSGRPYSPSDRVLNLAVIGAFKRAAVGIYFASQLGIGEHRLDDVWKSAPANEKAPFQNSAKALLDPKAVLNAPTLAETGPLARRLKITSSEPGLVAPVQQYYLATAFIEVAEAQLAAEGAQPP